VRAQTSLLFFFLPLSFLLAEPEREERGKGVALARRKERAATWRAGGTLEGAARGKGLDVTHP